jgi:hypothetical protein
MSKVATQGSRQELGLNMRKETDRCPLVEVRINQLVFLAILPRHQYFLARIVRKQNRTIVEAPEARGPDLSTID